MSKQIARAYNQFLKQEKKKKAQMKDVMSASSSGLLSRRSAPSKAGQEKDQMDVIMSFVDEIRKQGGTQNG